MSKLDDAYSNRYRKEEMAATVAKLLARDCVGITAGAGIGRRGVVTEGTGRGNDHI